MWRWLAVLVLTTTSVAFAQTSKGPKLPDGTSVNKDLAYGKHERQKLDLFVPKSETPLPVVIWIHGGGWEAGDKSGNPAIALLTQGYAVVGINYRLSQHAVFPAQIEDCKAAIRYLRDNAKKHNLDPDHFAVWGASAGGHLSLLLGTSHGVKDLEGEESKTSTQVQAVCDWFGPTDLVKLSPSFAKNNPITKLIGGTTGEKADLAKAANPITHLTKDDAPVLIFHGDEDSLVPLSQSELFAAAAKKTGIECELVTFNKANHGGTEFMKQVNSEAQRKKRDDFFAKYLKPKSR
ncbi:MAG: alpha/beta hydrolase fold domain-containing protein [Fimbriiglobus sp.]